MKRLIPSMLLVLCACASAIVFAAETKPSQPPAGESPAAKPSLPGQYAGKWKSSTDVTGALRIKIKQESAGWAAEASFSFEGAEIPTKMKEIQVDGSKVRLIFDWKIQDTVGQSKLSGEVTGDTLQGTYESKTASGESSGGTWIVTRA